MSAKAIILTHRMYGNRTLYTAWEPSSVMGLHSTITHDGSRWLGQIGTRHLPDRIEALRGGSEERIAACDEWRRLQYEEAYEAIIASHPEAAAGRRIMGEIELANEASAKREGAP